MPKYILYTKRDGFDFYVSDTKANYTFVFTPNASEDLEVIDSEKAANEIVSFIQLNKILPGTCDIILSDAVVFASDFITEPVPPQQNQSMIGAAVHENTLQPQIDTYLKAVPFEDITSKTTQIGNGIRVVAVNTEFYRTIISGLKRMNIITFSVVPVALVSGTLQNPPSLTIEILQLIEKNPDVLKQNNFYFVGRPDKQPEGIAAQEEKTKEAKKPTYILLGVFGILLLVLFIMFYKTFFIHPKPPLQTPQANTQAAASQFPVTVQVTPVASSSAATPQVTVHVILKAVATSSASAAIRNQLVSQGFSDIVNEQIPSASSGILAVFDTSISQIIQNKIIAAISPLYPTLHTQQAAVGLNQVIITIGN